MLCVSYQHAVSQAQANADLTGALWCVFMDTSGNWRAERRATQSQVSLTVEPRACPKCKQKRVGMTCRCAS